MIDALVESLKRLEAKLQGETPAAIDLWNETGRVFIGEKMKGGYLITLKDI